MTNQPIHERVPDCLAPIALFLSAIWTAVAHSLAVIGDVISIPFKCCGYKNSSDNICKFLLGVMIIIFVAGIACTIIVYYMCKCLKYI